MAERRVLLKLEYVSPTGSFKDRGAAVMVNVLADQGARSVADDSSGNAGAALAAYAARLGLQADVFTPAHASEAKRDQIAVYGARVHAIPGPRVNAKQAAIEAIGDDLTYASHAYHPAFLLGQQTTAWEVWEQLGHQAPDWVLVPVGQGVHLLGLWLGFRRLRAAGLIEHLPRLAAVQPTLLAPICQAHARGAETVSAAQPRDVSLAEGLAIAAPVRGVRVLQAIRESAGVCITVDEEAIRSAQRELAHSGFYVEPTSATAIAALRSEAVAAIDRDAVVIVPLTGSGLKGAPKTDHAGAA
jgi:threonine synthase